MKKLFLPLFISLASTGLGYTVTGKTYSTNGSEEDVRAATKAAADGDTIQIPAGSFTWKKPGVTVNIGVSILGAGASKTTITAPTSENGSWSAINLNSDSANASISGIAFNGFYAITVQGSSKSAIYHIHDCIFSCGTKQGVLLQLAGNGNGLIDHCSFTGGNGSEIIHNMGMGADDSVAGWQNNVSPGTINAVYIENCTFNKDPAKGQYFWGTSAIQSYYGAITVCRDCILNACQIDQHGNVGLVGARWWEFYNNTFYTPPNMNQSNYFALRGGSGVVFDNHVSGGPNTGGGEIELYSDDRTNPPPCGPGAGIFVKGRPSPLSSPVYIWGNDAAMVIKSGSANVTEGRNFFVSQYQPSSMLISQTTAQLPSASYKYAPYVYPHPLDIDSTTAFGPVAP
jgi:hypothetical protein